MTLYLRDRKIYTANIKISFSYAFKDINTFRIIFHSLQELFLVSIRITQKIQNIYLNTKSASGFYNGNNILRLFDSKFYNREKGCTD